jgi:integrase
VKLTDASIRDLVLPPGKSEQIWWDDTLSGLGFRLRKQLLANVATWVFFFRLAGKQHKPKIGDWPAMSAKAARAIAVKWYAQTKLGENPAPKAESEPEEISTGEMFDLYLEWQRPPRLRLRSFLEVERHLRMHAASLRRLPLHKIERRIVAALLARIGKSSTSVADATRKDLVAAFSWACREGLRSDNPAAFTNRFGERSRDRVLTDAEIAAIWRATTGDDPYSALVRLLLLVGARREELGALRWDELDLDAATISLPPSRTKSGRAHVIPLPPLALSLLKAQPPGEGAHVFGENGFKSWSRGKALLDQRSGVTGWRLHDLRRTLSTRLHEDLLQPPHIIEAILGHHQPGIGAVYNRSSYIAERRRVLDLWAEHLLGLIEGRPAKANVVAFRP